MANITVQSNITWTTNSTGEGVGGLYLYFDDDNWAYIGSRTSAGGNYRLRIYKDGSQVYSNHSAITKNKSVKIEYDSNNNEVSFYYWNTSVWTQIDSTQTYNLGTTAYMVLSAQGHSAWTGADPINCDNAYFVKGTYSTSTPSTYLMTDDFTGGTIDTGKWTETDPDSLISQSGTLIMTTTAGSLLDELANKVQSVESVNVTPGGGDWDSSLEIQSDNTKVSGSSDLTDYPALISDSNLTSAVYAGLQQSLNYSCDFELSSSQFSYVASNSALDITGDISCEAWVKLEQLPSTIGGNITIHSKYGANENRSWNFYLGSGDVLRMLWTSSGDTGSDYTFVGADSATVVAGDVGKWVHLACTIDVSGKTGTLYKNGVAVASTDTDVGGGSTSIYDSSAPFNVACVDNDGTEVNLFDGKLSNVRLWSDIRTPSEVLDNMHNTLTGTTNNLVGSWYNQDNDHNDNAGTNNLTASGSPTLGTDTPKAGNDLRITTDEAGTTEIPFEIVSLDTVAETSEIWAKVPTLSYNSATSLFVWYGNSSAVAYDADAT